MHLYVGMSCYVLVYHQKMPSHAISEEVIFKFSWGGMPPDPPSDSMLRMLVVLCTTKL